MPTLTSTLAEVGVALLLFGVGLHFRLADLLAVWRIALPGAVLQVGFGTALGGLLGVFGFGLGWGAALVFGLALAIASTAVATRMLAEQGQLAGPAGRLALGWLVVQDLLVVLALVMVPAAAGAGDRGAGRGAADRRAGAGRLRRLRVADRPPRPARAAVAPGPRPVAGALHHRRHRRRARHRLRGVGSCSTSPSRSAPSSPACCWARATSATRRRPKSMPLQRVFAALFFVSVGMLLDPAALLAAPLLSVGALLAVLLGIGLASFLLLLAFRVPPPIAARVAGALAQIGEFSFLLVKFAIGQGVLPASASAPILAAAFGGILLLPLSQRGFAWAARRLHASARWRAWQAAGQGPRFTLPETGGLAGHAILVGHGRVGRVVCAALRRHGLPLVVIEADRRGAEAARAAGLTVIWGDASRPEVLQAARPETAGLVVLALPDAAESRRVLQLVRAANPQIQAAARAHDDAEHDAAAGRGRRGAGCHGGAGDRPRHRRFRPAPAGGGGRGGAGDGGRAAGGAATPGLISRAAPPRRPGRRHPAPGARRRR